MRHLGEFKVAEAFRQLQVVPLCDWLPDEELDQFERAEARICAHCRRDPPDGNERPSAYNDEWLHPHCVEAFIRARMAKEGLLGDAPTSGNGGDPCAVVSEEPGLKSGPVRKNNILALEPDCSQTELVKFTKTGGPLTKRIFLAPDDALVKDGSACVMAHGTAERVRIAGVDAFGALIKDLAPSQAIALGSLRAGLPDRVKVTTEKLLNGVMRPDLIARTGDNIVYRGPAYGLLDFDSKGMATDVADELKRHGGFWPALLTVLPALKDVARVTRRSTSAGLSRSDTGATLPGSDGVHVYLAEKDGADSERFLRTLHERCWLAGFGWMLVSSSGATLERSIVDRMVGGPERLVFEGGPVLVPPLRQDKESRRPIAVDGVALDTVAACPPLTIVERVRLDQLMAKERARLAPEARKARAAFIETQAEKLVVRTGMPASAARQVIVRQCEGVLRPDVELPFDDPELARRTVGHVLANPEFYEGETLADPLEGVAYGRGVAKIMRRADGTPWIHSFAHGRTVYELKHAFASVCKAMQAAEKEETVAVFVRLVVCADVDAVELEELRQLAAKRAGVGLRVVSNALKAAQRMHAERRAREARQLREAEWDDPRPMIHAPLPDEPWLPQMDVLNEVIGKVATAVPPLRNIDGVIAQPSKRPVPDTRPFKDANPEGDD